MRATLVAFNQQLADLRAYIKFLRASTELTTIARNCLEPSIQDVLLQDFAELATSPAKRTIDYCAIIVTLYGAVEQFIEGMLRGYARLLNKAYDKYSQLPPIIASHHFQQTAELMARVDETRYRSILTREELVANLNSCLANSVPFHLNEYAFCHHTSNFRHTLIDELFKSLEVRAVLSRAKKCPPFSHHLDQIFPQQNVAQLKAKQIFECLDDLAERRNEVAHGSVQQILSLEILEDYITYHEQLCESIFEVVHSSATGVLATQKGKALGSPIVVYNNHIVCITMCNTSVKVGDVLISESKQGPCHFKGGRIQEIQLNNVSCQSVASWPVVNVGMRVNYRAPNGGKYYLLTQ